jgi:hypothetical protein
MRIHLRRRRAARAARFHGVPSSLSGNSSTGGESASGGSTLALRSAVRLLESHAAERESSLRGEATSLESSAREKDHAVEGASLRAE